VRALWRNPFLWAFLIGIVTLTLMRPLLRREPAPPPVLGTLPSYTLVDSTGRAFGSSDLAGQVYVVNFIFTRCASICPELTRAMAALERRYDEEKVSGVHLVSISVDPDHDTPERLAEYASSQGLDTSRWSFLTGERGQIAALLLGGFRVPMGEPETLNDLIDIAHTGKLVLVDRKGGIRGYYDSQGTGLDEVFHRSRHVLKESGS
jgi:protein SCO1/2